MNHSILDTDYVVEDINPSQIRTFGIKTKYKGQKVKNILDVETTKAVEARYNACIEENIPHTYDETLIADGELRHWNTMIIPVLDSCDGKSRIFGIAREMTALINAKESLAAINKGLEQAITERTMELQESNKKLKEQAYKDPLTNIGNRRYFFEHAGLQFNAAKDEQQPVSIIYADLDNFKQLNDTYGHIAGDLILQLFVERIDSLLGHSDIFARFGGEEFVILLPGADKNIARHKANQILTSINNNKFSTPKKNIQVTSSFGLATLMPTQDSVLQNLIRSADEALYKAKRKGKNRIEIA